jgi:hypothetical protein
MQDSSTEGPTGYPHALTADDIPSMLGARFFVTIVFGLLGLIFIASTALLINEFRDTDWPALLLLHSHLFVFFPTLGVLALVAFHLPATVFTHMYWTQIPYGRVRFMAGALVLLAATAWFSIGLLTNGPRQVWELAPSTLARDKSDPPNCGEGRGMCTRVSLMQGITSLRTAAQNRVGVSKFARVCRPDPLLEVPEEFSKTRFCFAAGGKLTGEDCCTAQARYGAEIDRLWTIPANRSLSDSFDLIALPAKTFFVLVVIIIGALLVIWRKLLERVYAPIAPAIERALLVGAVAMLPWPFMDYAYTQAMQTLSGRWTPSLQFRLSLVIAPWALLILVFFLARMGRKIERLGQLAGAGASVVALLRYEQINDASVRIVGVGAPIWVLPIIIILATVCLTTLRWPKRFQRAINGVIGRPPDEGTDRPPPFFKQKKKHAQKERRPDVVEM